MRGMIAGIVISLVVGAGAWTSSASAEPWSAPDARMTFEAPAGWSVQRAPVEGRVYVVTRSETAQCHLMIMARPATEALAPKEVRDAGAVPLAPHVWDGLPPAMPRLFGAESRLASTRVDQAGFWPIQFGRYESPTRVVHTAVQFRPGHEFWSFCYAASEGESDAALFETLQRSVGATDDAQLQAAVEEAEEIVRVTAQANQEAQRRRDYNRLMDDQRRLRELGLGSPDGAANAGASMGGSGGAGGGGGGGN